MVRRSVYGLLHCEALARDLLLVLLDPLRTLGTLFLKRPISILRKILLLLLLGLRTNNILLLQQILDSNLVIILDLVRKHIRGFL